MTKVDFVQRSLIAKAWLSEKAPRYDTLLILNCAVTSSFSRKAWSLSWSSVHKIGFRSTVRHQQNIFHTFCSCVESTLHSTKGEFPNNYFALQFSIVTHSDHGISAVFSLNMSSNTTTNLYTVILSLGYYVWGVDFAWNWLLLVEIACCWFSAPDVATTNKIAGYHHWKPLL